MFYVHRVRLMVVPAINHEPRAIRSSAPTLLNTQASLYRCTAVLSYRRTLELSFHASPRSRLRKNSRKAGATSGRARANSTVVFKKPSTVPASCQRP